MHAVWQANRLEVEVQVLQLGWVLRSRLGEDNEEAQFCSLRGGRDRCNRCLLQLWRRCCWPATKESRQHQSQDNNNGHRNVNNNSLHNDKGKGAAVLPWRRPPQLPGPKSGQTAAAVQQQQHPKVLRLDLRPLPKVFYNDSCQDDSKANNDRSEAHPAVYQLHHKHDFHHHHNQDNHVHRLDDNQNDNHNSNDDDDNHRHNNVGNHGHYAAPDRESC